MTIKRILEMRLMAAILMLFASTMPLFAQQPTLDKNDEGYYMINQEFDDIEIANMEIDDIGYKW